MTDCHDDPVLEIAKDVLLSLNGDEPELQLIKHHFHVLPAPLTTCSLKCSAFTYAISKLPSEVDVVVSVDADAVVTPNWLETLIAPLEDPKVGVSSGNRWFKIPANRKIGSAVRAVWNAAAVVQMYLYQIPWGGSLAIRRDVINDGNLMDQWSNAFCEDTLLSQTVKELGLTFARPPEVVVVNEESITCQNAFRWIRRQLLTVRLHNRHWPLVFLHGLTVGLPLLVLELMVLGLFMGSGNAVTILLVSFLVFELTNLLLLIGIRRAHKHLLRRAGEEDVSEWSELFWYAIALPITQLIHFGATISAAVASQVSWRQIQYRIGKSKVELVEYRPFITRSEQQVEQQSID